MAVMLNIFIYIDIIQKVRLINGKPGNKFVPKGNATRA